MSEVRCRRSRRQRSEGTVRVMVVPQAVPAPVVSRVSDRLGTGRPGGGCDSSLHVLLNHHWFDEHHARRPVRLVAERQLLRSRQRRVRRQPHSPHGPLRRLGSGGTHSLIAMCPVLRVAAIQVSA